MAFTLWLVILTLNVQCVMEAAVLTRYLDLYPATFDINLSLPFIQGLSAGFPSPAADFIDLTIDLNREIVRNPASTFFGRVKGISMIDVHINDGDIVVVDKSITCKNNDIAVCFLDGEFLIKRVRFEKRGCSLLAENENYPPILVKPESDFIIWGVVISVIKFF